MIRHVRIGCATVIDTRNLDLICTGKRGEAILDPFPSILRLASLAADGMTRFSGAKLILNVP